MEKKLKILMLEDLEEDAGLVRHNLSKSGIAFDLQRVDTREEFVNALKYRHPDIILSDHALPQFNSIEALQIYKDIQINVPFILVTGTVSEEFAVTCLKEGADDYVLKTNLTRLAPAIQQALKQRELIEKKSNAESALQAQNEILKKVNQELDSFVYSVSHNLRAPLLSLLGLLNLVKKEDQARGNHFSEYFSMMNHSIIKLDETLKEILAYSRNARNQLEYQEIDIKTLIEECLSGLQYIQGFDALDKKIIVDKEHIFYSDKHRIMFIFNNLISNAINYRDREKDKSYLHIIVTIDRETARIIFEDNGVGIPNIYQPKVFDMFYRASELSDGAGLGLYIVKETVSKLKGKIILESRVGQGTRFTIELPNRYL